MQAGDRHVVGEILLPGMEKVNPSKARMKPTVPLCPSQKSEGQR